MLASFARNLRHHRLLRINLVRTCQTAAGPTSKSNAVPPKRKLKQRVTPDAFNVNHGDGVCAAYCVHNPVSLQEAAHFLQSRTFTAEKQGGRLRFHGTQTAEFSADVVHMSVRGYDDETVMHDGHAFFFSSGAVVFWGLPFTLRREMFDAFATFQETRRRDVSKCALQVADFEHEFRYTVDAARIQASFRNDEIQLVAFEDVVQLLALSYGLAQSVRLLVYEAVIDSLVGRTRTLPDELAEHGHVKLSHRELKRLIGELLAARYSVNLVSDILDTPEYFWQHAELERLHLECSHGVELQQRSRILDTRTEVIKDVLALLNNELSASSSDRVERAILFLIAVEVAMEVAKAFFLASAA